jgi:hypothetical protein
MAFVFNLLGMLATVVSVAWGALLLSRVGSAEPMVLIFAAMPAIWLLGSALMFLAIGSGLDYLRRIARNTADVADAVEELVARTPKQP